MKKSLLTILLALNALFVLAQSTIDPLLAEEMERRSNDEQMKVIVIMKARYDRALLNRQADYFTTRAERRDFVVNELKEFAASSQYDLKQALAEMERSGMVTTPSTLWMSNSLTFHANKAAIRDLARRNDIEVIGYAIERCWIPEEETPRTAPASREITSNVIQVGANQVWELGYTGEGVVVAVVDTGVNYNHLDVADHLWDGGQEFPNHGYDVYNNDNNPMDDQGHGSHCAGTVLGDGTAGSQTGMAPNATLMCVKCINSNGNGGAEVISAGMEWAVEHGCDVFSMSLGVANSTIPERTLLRRTCETSLDAGIAGALAAGNEGGSQWQYPIPNNVRVPGSCPPPYIDAVQGENSGKMSCSICIGAVDGNDNAAYFTSRGPVTWTNTEFGDYPYQPEIGLIRPDVCAPGVDIKSLDYQGNNGYTTMSGTSMATPCAAGCIALMLSKDPNLMPADICRILEETAVPLAEGKSNTYGFGRINVLAAVEAIQLGAVQYNSFYQIHDPEGNNNGVLNPNESVMMSVVMVNTTEEPMNNVSIALTTEDENVTITQNTATCPSFAPNEALMVDNAFAFTVSDDVVAKQEIRFNLEVYLNGEQTGTFGIVVPVFDYLLQYGTTAVLDDNNGNGLLNPGETADLRIFVDNAGNELAEMITGTLSTDNEWITLGNPEQSFSTIGANLMGFADFNVTLDASAPEDFVIPFTLNLVDCNGRHTELAFAIRNACNVIFSLHDSYGDGWQGNYLEVTYSDGTPSEQMTVQSGYSANFTRELATGSNISLTWHNGQWTSECSFEVTYDDGSVIFQNAGGFNGTQTLHINCFGGGTAPEFCDPARNLTYTAEGNIVHLTWEAPENVENAVYEVYRGSTMLVMGPATALDDVVEEGVYNYCVHAVYSENCQTEYVCVEVEVSLCSGVQHLDYTLDDDLLLTLTWDTPENPSGLIEYQVYMDNELIGSTTNLTYAFNIAEGEHDINVKAVFEGCEKDAHVQVCVIGAVENLDYVLEDLTATVLWDALEGVGVYEVEVQGEVVATVEETHYIFEVEEGLTSVVVRPVVDGCYTLDADVEICICKPVENLRFVKLDADGMLHFNWDGASHDSYYEVTCNGGDAQTVYSSDAVFAAQVGTNSIIVVAHSDYGCDSEPVSLTQNVCAGVDGFDYSFDGALVTITWNGDAESYKVMIDNDWLLPETVETPSYTTALEGSHFIEVMPDYGDDCVAFTARFDFEVINVVPEIRITDIHEGQMATSWNSIDRALSYNLFRDYELIAEGLTDTEYNDTEMAINMQHCYTVKAVYEKGISAHSNEACANYFTGLGESDNQVTIFPNPTSDKVTIQCAGMTLIEVYSAEGKLVRKIEVDEDTFQLEGLENGLYTVRILKGDDIFVRSIIKTR